ncbi:MAG: putative glycoside hydrolase [Armatimonadota bacterium]
MRLVASVLALLCEWQPNPTAVWDRCPEFSWQAPEQSAFRLAVAPTREALERDEDLTWNSGKVDSSLPIVEYAGPPLADKTTYYWRVTIWDEDGRKGPPSPVQQFTTSFRPLPRRLPHIRTFLNFGSDPATIAQRYDLTFRADAKRVRPDILTVNYSLLATMVIPSDKADSLARFCVERGLTEEGVLEDMFVHFREDHKVTLHVGAERPENPRETRTCPGWDPRNDRNGDGRLDDAEFAQRANPRASARRMQDARVPIYYWGPPRDDFVMNVGHPLYQQFLAQVYVPARARGFDGLFIDTTPPDVPGPGGSGDILEYPRRGRDADAWLRDMQVMLGKIKTALGERLLLANGWNARPFVIDGTEWENWLNIGHSLSRVESRLAACADLQRRGKLQLIQYNPIFDEKATPFGVKVDVPKERDRLYGLALYYLIAGDHTYFGIGQHPYRRSEQMWFDAIAYDIGEPKGDYYVFAEGTDDLPQGNLLENGDFEALPNADGTPSGWTAAPPVELVADEKHGGDSCVKIASDSPAINNINKQYVRLKPDTAYTLCAWIKTRDVTGNGAQVYPYEFEGATGGGIAIAVTGTTDWTFYSQVFKTGADAEGRINYRIFGGTGTAWFDDIRLIEGAHGNWKVLARDYDRALVLVKPPLGVGYGDDTATTLRLPRPLRLLNMDATLAPPQSDLRLRDGEAAILVAP